MPGGLWPWRGSSYRRSFRRRRHWKSWETSHRRQPARAPRHGNRALSRRTTVRGRVERSRRGCGMLQKTRRFLRGGRRPGRQQAAALVCLGGSPGRRVSTGRRPHILTWLTNELPRRIARAVGGVGQSEPQARARGPWGRGMTRSLALGFGWIRRHIGQALEVRWILCLPPAHLCGAWAVARPLLRFNWGISFRSV